LVIVYGFLACDHKEGAFRPEAMQYTAAVWSPHRMDMLLTEAHSTVLAQHSCVVTKTWTCSKEAQFYLKQVCKTYCKGGALLLAIGYHHHHTSSEREPRMAVEK
jgi:hypothetical protein